MVISDKYKYVFIANKRTASSSISRELRDNYCGKNIYFNFGGKHKGKHAPYSEFQKVATPEQENYLVFMGIRNPLDFAVSLYYRHKSLHNCDKTFAEWLKYKGKKLVENPNLHSLKDVDLVIRYENLQEDFAKVLKSLGIEKKREIPNFLGKTPGKNGFLNEYNTPELRKLAIEIFSEKMEEYGYEFPKEWIDGYALSDVILKDYPHTKEKKLINSSYHKLIQFKKRYVKTPLIPIAISEKIDSFLGYEDEKIIEASNKHPEKKIYQIGFNKTGTLSLHKFFTNNGLKSIHFDRGNLARTIFENHKSGNPLFKGYEEYDAFTDMEAVLEHNSGQYNEELFLELSKKGVHPKLRRASEELFKEMYHNDPEGVFILSIRPLEDWIRSRLNHNMYWKWYRKDENTTQQEVIEYWEDEYKTHIKNVKDFFKDKDNLIIFDISKHDGEYLVKKFQKFGFDFDSKYWDNYTAKAKEERLKDKNSKKINKENLFKNMNIEKYPKTVLVACARNEGPYLLEWVCYHKLLGFTDIYIYSHDNTDGSEKLLEKLQDIGLITYVNMTGRLNGTENRQVYMYKKALDKIQKENRHDWISFIDLDEFIVLKNHETIQEYINSLPSDTKGVLMNWKCFNSNNQIKKEKGLVIKRFTRSTLYQNDKYKTLANLKYVKSTGGAHNLGYTDKDYCPSSDKENIIINHYITKSLNESMVRHLSGMALRSYADLNVLNNRRSIIFRDIALYPSKKDTFLLDSPIFSKLKLYIKEIINKYKLQTILDEIESNFQKRYLEAYNRVMMENDVAPGKSFKMHLNQNALTSGGLLRRLLLWIFTMMSSFFNKKKTKNSNYDPS